MKQVATPQAAVTTVAAGQSLALEASQRKAQTPTEGNHVSIAALRRRLMPAGDPPQPGSGHLQ